MKSTHTITNASVLLLALIADAGCLSAEPDASSPSAEATQPVATGAQPQLGTDEPPSREKANAPASVDEVCRKLLTRQRECAAVFIPALVKARVDSDNPSGIAASDAKLGREALVSEALEEYAEDSKDTAIRALCDKIAAGISPERSATLRTSGSECLAKTPCDPFVSCAMPLSLTRWTEGS
jgi:hypothetical protein